MIYQFFSRHLPARLLRFMMNAASKRGSPAQDAQPEPVRQGAEYIEAQERLHHPFGVRDIASAGCGAVAVYNLLLFFGMPRPFESVVRALEADGMILGGRFGTAPAALCRCLRRSGLHISLCRGALPAQGGFLFLIQNDPFAIGQGLHYFCLIPERDGWRPLNCPLHGSYSSPEKFCGALRRRARLLGIWQVTAEI